MRGVDGRRWANDMGGSGSGVGAGVEGTEEVDASANCLG